MKNKLNIILLISFIIAILLTLWLNSQISKRVGDIAFNKEIDDSSFKVCDENRITQYYSSKSGYQNGQQAIKKEIWNDVQSIIFQNSGYVTFRFIVNCNGETGRFRIKTVNNNLKKVDFDPTNIKKLKSYIQNLKNWNAGTRQDKKLDSYVLVNFKIENGHITDIF